MSEKRYIKRSRDDVAEERSTCGFRRRIFRDGEGVPTGITHLKTDDAKPHWHKVTHEYYFVIRGEGKMIIDGEEIPLRAGDCVYLKPGAVHQAVGDLESLVIASPPYSAEDILYPSASAQ